ncbi:response regulator [Gramella sp. BOM4]|nr:response regulator [Christiangramia bathymodioli]
MRRSVVVIDDDEVYQTIIRKFISRAEVFTEASYYTSPVDALAGLKSAESLPDFILLDINMPLMDGWQLLKELEELFPGLYHRSNIYIVTSSIAYSDKQTVKEFPGVKGFLSKPLNVAKLREIVAAVKQKSPA